MWDGNWSDLLWIQSSKYLLLAIRVSALGFHALTELKLRQKMWYF